MINLEPIPKKIQKRLFEKMRALGRQSNSTTGQSIDTEALTHEKMASRTTFIRMTSGQANAVTLMGGLLKDDGGIRGGYDDIYGSRNYKVGGLKGVSVLDGEFDEDYPGKILETSTQYIYGDASEETRKVNTTDKRPMPGIKSIDVQFKGGLKALREATINWTCWSFEDLNELSPHFLAHGKTVMIQWGWVYDDKSFRNIPEFLVTDDAGNRFISDDAFANYKNQIIDGKGDFDMMTGIVKNFEYTTREDGAFDCTTTLTSVGVNIVDNPEPNEQFLPKHLTYNLNVKGDSKETISKLSKAIADDDGGSGKLNDPEKSKLINLNTNVSLKLFIKNIDKYIITELVEKIDNTTQHKTAAGSEQGSFAWIPNKCIMYAPTYQIEVLEGEEKNAEISKLYKTDSVLSALKETKDSKFKVSEIGNLNQIKYWVSWGWFEDNVLSKFTTRVSEQEQNIVNSFRSLERVLTSDGEDSNLYESVRIKNHEYLQTIDPYNYVLPGQIIPQEKTRYSHPDDPNDFEEVPGDSEQIKGFARIVNDVDNFEPFSTQTDNWIQSKFLVKTGKTEPFKTGRLIQKTKKVLVKKARLFRKAVYKQEHVGFEEEIGKRDVLKEEITSTIPVPGKFGYLRNMLISIDTIKEAFGVGGYDTDFTVESISISEAMSNLFSILNRPINFWNFQLVTDSIDTERVKIIDEQSTKFDFSKPVNSQRSKVDSNGDVFTDKDPGSAGVFFFPVWRGDSIIKRQNLTAKVPDAMALTAMYGANLDQVKELTNVGNEHQDTGAVIAGGLYNGNDKSKGGITVAIKSGNTENKSFQNIGTKNHYDNMDLSTDGDDILTFIKTNAETLSKTFEQIHAEDKKKLDAAKIIQSQEERDKAFADSFDASKPPPLIDKMDRGQVFRLLRHLNTLEDNTLLQKLFGKKDKDKFKQLFNSKYMNKSWKLKREFVESIKYITDGEMTSKDRGTVSVLVPLDVELDIDGTGGIYPGNSFHSTYLPTNYKNKSIFQMFDVSHKVDSSGWTTSVTGKMRSTLNMAFPQSRTNEEINKDVLSNYVDMLIGKFNLEKGNREAALADKEKGVSYGQGGGGRPIDKAVPGVVPSRRIP